MTPAAPKSTTKNVIVELVLLGLAQSKLKDTGLGAMRGVLLSDARLAVLDGAVDLQCVWDLLEGQPGWDAEAALGPLCFVKALETRLAVTVKLPAPMSGLSPEEISRRAAGCRPKREDVDRAISGEIPEKKKKGLAEFTAPVAMPGTAPRTPQWKKVMAVLAAAATLVSLVVLIHLAISELGGSPTLTPLDTTDFAGDIPLKSAERWGTEVHAVLGDPSWMRQPEPKRRAQLERAMSRLAARQYGTLVITDDAKRTRATAQMFGRPPKVFIRFY